MTFVWSEVSKALSVVNAPLADDALIDAGEQAPRIGIAGV
jgi:hypothetical protein